MQFRPLRSLLLGVILFAAARGANAQPFSLRPLSPAREVHKTNRRALNSFALHSANLPLRILSRGAAAVPPQTPLRVAPVSMPFWQSALFHDVVWLVIVVLGTLAWRWRERALLL